ncbi:DUF4089 domain-containing protein [Oleomonas cavernae]|uniref:DUF4089 domain-containing protein n=1 Tax=Oleomonas cavernae TaxID=2320859 RepID=A0A418WEG6_9PROT|nr:DUF4089 domain-containing protein [Oleomonas cavernae]
MRGAARPDHYGRTAPRVSQFLTLAAAMAALVEAAPLGDDVLDLAGIFSPITPA